MAIHLADHLVGAGPIHMDGGEPLWPFEPPPESAATPPAPPPSLPSVWHEPGVLNEAPANWLQQLPPPVAWHTDIAYVAPEWGGPLGHSPLLDLPAPELAAPPLAPVAQPAPAPESALAPALASVPAASPASATGASAATVPASSAAAEVPVGADWLVQREAALQALRADFTAAHQEALALDRDILQSPDAPAFSEARFAEAFLAEAVATGNGAWQTLAALYDTDPATLVARHSALLDLALNDHALNAGPPPPGHAMGSVEQLGMTDLVLADPLMREVAQTFGRTPDAPRTALAWEQVRLYGQTRYEQMTLLHIGMESVRDQYSAALDRASQTADGPGWVDVPVQREVTAQSVQGDGDVFERHTVTTTERRFDPDAFTRWYNAQDGLANRAFAQLYGNSHTEYQAPLQHRGEAMPPAGPPTVSRIRFDNAPWHIDGLGAPMRREGLVGLDLNTAPRMNNDAAVGFDFEVGWATAPENIYDRPSTTRQLVQLAAVVATSYFTYGAVSGWAGGLGLGATSAAAVAGGAAAAAGSFTSGVMNGNLALKDIVRSAFSGALTAGLMQGLAATQVVRNAGDIGQMAMRMTVQGGVQALMGGEFRDGAAAAFASGLAQAVGQQLNDSFARSLPASDAAAARMVTRIVTSAIRALGNPGDPLSAFAGSLLNEVLQGSGLSAGSAQPVTRLAFDDEGLLMPGMVDETAPLAQQVAQLQQALLAQGFAPQDASSLAWHRLSPLPDPFTTVSDADDRSAAERIADQSGIPRDQVVDAGFFDDAARSAALLRGLAEGVGFSAISSLEGLIELARSPMQFVQGVKALLTSAEARGQFAQDFVDRIRVDVQMLEDAYSAGDWRGTGQQLGKLTADLGQIAGGVQALARLGVTGGTAAGRVLVGAAEGFTERVGHVRSLLGGVQVPDDVAARIASNFGRDGDAFTTVAEQMAAARMAGWRKADGGLWWPPHDGAVPGSQLHVTLQPGTRLDRFGGTSPTSTFLSPIGVGIEQRALRPDINLNIRDEYVVVKPFPVEQSNVMPWFGQAGMGIQFDTGRAIGMTVTELVLHGFIRKIEP